MGRAEQLYSDLINVHESRKQIKRGRVGVIHLLNHSAAIWNANIMSIPAKKMCGGPNLLILTPMYLPKSEFETGLVLSDFFVYELLFFV